MKITIIGPITDETIWRQTPRRKRTAAKVVSRAAIPDFDSVKFECLFGRDERCPHRERPCNGNIICNCSDCKFCPKGFTKS